jgi:hypothetical protein
LGTVVGAMGDVSGDPQRRHRAVQGRLGVAGRDHATVVRREERGRALQDVRPWILAETTIVRHFSCSKYKFVYCPCEMHLSSWAPTLTHTLSFD